MEMVLWTYTSKKKGLRQCSRDYNISESTFLRHVRDEVLDDHLGELLHSTETEALFSKHKLNFSNLI